MTTLADYLGRRIDVVAWHGSAARGVVQLQPFLVNEDSSGEICTGIVKLAQRFLLELLTERGSIKHQPSRGCQFMTLLQSGKARTTADLQAIFALAELEIRTNLHADELADDPDDERYAGATLIGTTVTPGRVIIGIRIASVAESVKVVLPISIVV